MRSVSRIWPPCAAATTPTRTTSSTPARRPRKRRRRIQNNSITAGGDVIAGAIQVDSGAFTDMHGMSNVVMNTAPMANVQGIMSLNLVLH